MSALADDTARLRAPLEPGAPAPLGAHPGAQGVNFAVYSEHAEQVDLCLFDPSGTRELRREPLPGRTGSVWHGLLPGAVEGLLYGYRAHGPYRPLEGLRFNSNKLLLDPYARSVAGALRWSPEVLGYSECDPGLDLSFSALDSAAAVPKARVVAALARGDAPPRPRIAPADTVLYELHVRGYTMRHPDVPAALRGTYAALACEPVLGHLRRLGVTTVQLLPVHFFVSERRLAQRGLVNYWGYNPLAFLCPHPGYASPGADARVELRQAVRSLHRAGLEVVIDVVFNHTAESDELGPTLSLRGLDNAVYYHLDRNQPRRYENFTGCGNTLNLAHPAVRALVIDALRFWADELEVDGFRFDLAAALARGEHGIDPSGGVFAQIRADPLIAGLKLIAEPWDCGADGHQLGRFAPGWLEWNDGFRDAARAFWLRRDGRRDEFARRLTASADTFRRAGRAPSASVNFVTAHDGFTLADLLRYEQRHNQANGEDNRDGASHNLGWNCGAEGPSDDPQIGRMRAQLARALLATTLLSQGTPMLCAGDEFGRTQRGNNNAYCQDNSLSWIDWTSPDEALAAFVGTLTSVRRRAPVLDPGRWYDADADAAAGPALRWLRAQGGAMTVGDWHDRAGVVFGCLSSDVAGGAADRLLLMNAGLEPLRFALPAGRWRRLLDSAPEPPAAVDSGWRDAYPLQAQSLAVLQRQPGDCRDEA